MNDHNSRHLHRALRLPRTHRWVSDWLFSSPHTPFHPNITIPPHFFSHARTFDCRSKLRTAFQEFSKVFSTICIPVATLDNILVGYSLCLPTEPFTMPQNGARDPFRPPWCARFAFDTKVGDMLHVMLDGARRDIGLHLMHFLRPGITQMSLIVPLDDYAFDKLPNTVLSSWVVTERRLESICSPSDCLRQQQDRAENLLDWSATANASVTPDATSSSSEGDAPQNVNPFDYIDNVLDATASTDDLHQSVNPIAPQSVSRSHVPLANFFNCTSVYGGTTCLDVSADCALQACTSLDSSLAMLFDLSVGRFASPLVHSDRLGLWTGLNNTTFPCKFVRSVAYASQQDSGVLRQALSSTYFFAVLSVTSDQRLLTVAAPTADAEEQSLEITLDQFDLGQLDLPEDNQTAGSEVSGGESRSSLNQTWAATEATLKNSQVNGETPPTNESASAGPVPIAPANEPQPHLKRVGLGRAESAEERRRRLAVERQKRNRLSAARSNAKKKKWIEAMGKEIAENKAKVKVLQQLETVLMWEREQLKHIARSADALR